MGKYQPLAEYLKKSGKASITLSFTEIESIICDTLPEKSSQTWSAWWSNDQSQTHPQASAWLSAGYTAKINCGNSVTFTKIAAS